MLQHFLWEQGRALGHPSCSGDVPGALGIPRGRDGAGMEQELWVFCVSDGAWFVLRRSRDCCQVRTEPAYLPVLLLEKSS